MKKLLCLVLIFMSVAVFAKEQVLTGQITKTEVEGKEVYTLKTELSDYVLPEKYNKKIKKYSEKKVKLQAEMSEEGDEIVEIKKVQASKDKKKKSKN